MKILFFGDIVGRMGREAVTEQIGALRRQYTPDIIIANAENASGGFGLSREGANTLLFAGVDVFTMGNHVYSKREVINLFDEMAILRPSNLPASDPGRGFLTVETPSGERLAVINLIGKLYMDLPCENPFTALDGILSKIDTPHIFVDFHAEATSEKKALGFYADGRVSALVGTHTHVQTADDTILEGGTAYITDVGMCGAARSVLGAAILCATQRFTSAVRRPYEAATEGEKMINAVFLETDKDGHAILFERISYNGRNMKK